MKMTRGTAYNKSAMESDLDTIINGFKNGEDFINANHFLKAIELKAKLNKLLSEEDEGLPDIIKLDIRPPNADNNPNISDTTAV